MFICVAAARQAARLQLKITSQIQNDRAIIGTAIGNPTHVVEQQKLLRKRPKIAEPLLLQSDPDPAFRSGP